MHHYFEDAKRFMLVTDICTGGELLEILSQQPHGKFGTLQAGNIIKQILSGIVYMHNNNENDSENEGDSDNLNRIYLKIKYKGKKAKIP